MKKYLLFLSLFVVGMLGMSGRAYAAFERNLEPVIVLGSETGKYLGKNIEGLRLYSYSSATDVWNPVPFQVDEFKADSNPEKEKKIVWKGDSLLSALDEIVFMGKDVGQKAADTAWPADDESQNDVRYEIAITDPVTLENGYVYIFYSNTMARNSNAYVSYEKDYVNGASYRMGHDTSDASGLPDFLSITGNNIDFLDSWRIRAYIKKIIVEADLGIGGTLPFTGSNIYFSEEMNTSFDLKYNFITVQVNAEAYHLVDSLKVRAGQIRVLREHTLAIRIWTTGLDAISRIPITIYYYDNLVQFKPTFSLDMGEEVKELVTYFIEFGHGFNDKAKNMKFYGNGLLNSSSQQDSLINQTPANVSFTRNIADIEWPGKYWAGYSGQSSSSVNAASLMEIVDLQGKKVEPSNPQEIFWDYTQNPDFDPAGVYGVYSLKIRDWASPPAESFDLDATIRNYYLAKNSSRSELRTLFEKYKDRGLTSFTEQIYVEPPDNTPPGRIADLAVSDRTNNSMTITWTAPGDDGEIGGPAATYYIRYSDVAPVDPPGGYDWTWWSSPVTKTVANAPKPAAPGTLQSVTVTGLSEATTYYFRMNVVDDVGRESGLSNIASTWTTPVELVSFVGHVNGKNEIVLNWSTASETNNLGFAVERRLANEELWKEIGFVRGFGTTVQNHDYFYSDAPGKPGDWNYRLKQIDADGSAEYFDPILVSIAVPQEFVLMQNYPNPFNPETTISFQLPESAEGRMTLLIYDLLGRLVRTLVDLPAAAGYYDFKWDGLDDAGFLTSSGVYIYRLRAGEFTATKKMIKLQ